MIQSKNSAHEVVLQGLRLNWTVGILCQETRN